ncbi:hypothetical protein Pcac1_g22650 [Phytophthora cactorum]|nr:hypothetical protein Pcac1_g22650 [Phytophthora cactorum]
MKEQVFCIVPEGVELDGNFDCLELVKAIYGLKQASRVWNETFDEFVVLYRLPSFGFRPVRIYIKVVDGHCVLVLVYVDDVLITGSSPELIARTKTDLKTRFEMTDSGKCVFVLGSSWWAAQTAVWRCASGAMWMTLTFSSASPCMDEWQGRGESRRHEHSTGSKRRSGPS